MPRLGQMETPARPTWRSRVWIVALVVLVTIWLALAAVGIDRPQTALAGGLVATGAAVSVLFWATETSRRRRRAYEDELTAWAAESAAQAERLRIARELHDLASHGLGLITVRAAASRTADDRERARALADIERAGREATTELRRMLAVLRTPGDDAPLHPAETLDELPRIVAAVEHSGVRAEVIADDVDVVSPGVQLTVCAVVREALSNTARHAGPTGARVTVRREGDEVLVDVTDDGPQPGWRPHPGSGHGLSGLRERVAAFDGALEAGPWGSGFRVHARVPDRGAA